MDIAVGVSLAKRAALQAAGQQIPNGLRIRALVDTGAACTCIDPGVLRALGLSPTGTAPMLTPSTGTQAHIANQYDVSLALLGPKNITLTFPAVAVAESQLAIQGIQCLLGRDVLAECLFVYDGPAGLFTLAF